jgi:hypothetical protein
VAKISTEPALLPLSSGVFPHPSAAARPAERATALRERLARIVNDDDLRRYIL